MDVPQIGQQVPAGGLHGFAKPVGVENIPDHAGLVADRLQQRKQGGGGAEIIVGLKQQRYAVGSRCLYGLPVTVYIPLQRRFIGASGGMGPPNTRR